jgi:hypothetical protein
LGHPNFYPNVLPHNVQTDKQYGSTHTLKYIKHGFGLKEPITMFESNPRCDATGPLLSAPLKCIAPHNRVNKTKEQRRKKKEKKEGDRERGGRVRGVSPPPPVLVE